MSSDLDILVGHLRVGKVNPFTDNIIHTNTNSITVPFTDALDKSC